jgi:hypothetical protein
MGDVLQEHDFHVCLRAQRNFSQQCDLEMIPKWKAVHVTVLGELLAKMQSDKKTVLNLRLQRKNDDYRSFEYMQNCGRRYVFKSYSDGSKSWILVDKDDLINYQLLIIYQLLIRTFTYQPTVDKTIVLSTNC